MAEKLELTAEEREFLVTLLEIVLRDTRVEERRTDHRSYREQVKHREDIIQGLLDKLAAVPASEEGIHQTGTWSS